MNDREVSEPEPTGTPMPCIFDLCSRAAGGKVAR
jgi:hypothetical protein